MHVRREKGVGAYLEIYREHTVTERPGNANALQRERTTKIARSVIKKGLLSLLRLFYVHTHTHT